MSEMAHSSDSWNVTSFIAKFHSLNNRPNNSTKHYKSSPGCKAYFRIYTRLKKFRDGWLFAVSQHLSSRWPAMIFFAGERERVGSTPFVHRRAAARLAINRLKVWAYDWVKPAVMPALSISGPGGVGKSALVARFMLEHSRVVPDARLLFAYLDFDRSVLSITEPETLLAEMLYQLDLQFQGEGYFRELRDSFTQQMASVRGGKTAEISDNYSRVTTVITELMKLIEDSLGPRPFVIVLDTFEEVQYRGEKLAYPLWEMLDRMQQSFPFLRVVVSGCARSNH